jgi:predicted enzyme related to lactoylglutathione lyase
MISNSVGWFEIYVQDMARAKKFYETVFNITLSQLDNPMDSPVELWAFPMQDGAYGAPGALVKIEGVPSGPGGTLIYFSCTDCSIEAKTAAASGGAIFKDKMAIGQYGYIAMVTDTEGNTIGLHSMQ